MYLHDGIAASVCLAEKRIDKFGRPGYAVRPTVADIMRDRDHFPDRENVAINTFSPAAQQQRDRLVAVTGKEVRTQRGVMRFRHAQGVFHAAFANSRRSHSSTNAR